ncbi:MAG: phosphate acyltransferase PlsX, partial [Chloroflexota bacterium]
VNDVAGAVDAAREFGVTVILVGPKAQLAAELAKHKTDGLSLEIVNATQTIEMEEHPANAIRDKKDASINVGLKLVRDKLADAFASAGNTGAVMAGALVGAGRVGRIQGIERPALVAALPQDTTPVLVLDIGANTDCKPEYLKQFAQMGSLYAEKVIGIARPRVALLANGEEDTKGDALVQAAHGLLKQLTTINFIGNIEPKDVLKHGADVVVCDGFVGNILLKTAEGMASLMSATIRQEIKSNPITMLGGALASPAFNRIRKRLDPAEVGGAPLLGVDGVVIIGHGRSDARAIKNMIRTAMRAVESDVLGAIRKISEQ